MTTNPQRTGDSQSAPAVPTEGANQIVFVSYRRPLRSRKTLIEFLGTVAVGLISANIAISAPRDANGFPGMLAFVLGVIVIITCALSLSLLWGMLSGRVHEVEVTDSGILYDGRHWPWALVKKITHRVTNSNSMKFLWIEVQTGPLRSPRALLIEVQPSLWDNPVLKLQVFLRAAHPEITWR